MDLRSSHRRRLVEVRVNSTSYDEVIQHTLSWAKTHDSRYICFANVYSLMEAHDSPEFRRSIESADLVTPDGMPLVWGLRLLGVPTATRVYGPDLTLLLLAAAEAQQVPVAFYGGTKAALDKLLSFARTRFPSLVVGYAFSPPFRHLTLQEDEHVVEAIRSSGVGIVFVGLSTPKQELWMAAHRGRVNAVMLGVGAAFDFLSGAKPQAPRWMMRLGLEWFFRLCSEPKRLWKRYCKHNPRFLFYFLRQLLFGSR